MKIRISIFCLLVFGMTALTAEDNIVIDPARFLLVNGKKGNDGFIIPVKNKNNRYSITLRTGINPYPGRLLLQGKAEGQIRAVWLMIIAQKDGRKVFDKGVWIPSEKLLKEGNTVQFSGILDLTGVRADRFYFYFQTFTGKECPVRPISFTITTQED